MPNEVILIVEDNDLNLYMAKFLLQRAGFKTLEAKDAVNAIAMAKALNPDLILMDINLPGLDGYEATKIIKSISALANIPIVGFTAHAMQDELQKALNGGFVGIISKPLDVDHFADQIAEFLSASEQKIQA